jgi:RNA polymerase sigma factor for flagellar operon FliA
MEFDSQQVSQEDRLNQQRMVDLVREGIAKLPERQQLVLSLYYVDELSQQQVGEVLGVSESRVSQILGEITDKLRKHVKRVMKE